MLSFSNLCEARITKQFFQIKIRSLKWQKQFQTKETQSFAKNKVKVNVLYVIMLHLTKKKT